MIATRPEVDEHGRYSGGVDFYSYGPTKVVAMEEAATRDGIDLSASYAYSDSITDEPMLSAVGHPVVVNPDRALARIAAERDWEVRIFERPVKMRERVSMPTPGRTAAISGGLAAIVAGVVVFWVLRHKPAPTRRSGRWRRSGPDASRPSRTAGPIGRAAPTPALISGFLELLRDDHAEDDHDQEQQQLLHPASLGRRGATVLRDPSERLQPEADDQADRGHHRGPRCQRSV